MPHQTNLNISPYFDDYDSTNGFHKVLFKPGLPLQARELTTLQSILQNQVEQFGRHYFKEGSKVIPGNIGYNQLQYCVKLNNNYKGVPVSAYVDQLIGNKITGLTSGVSAIVESVVFPGESETRDTTLYIKYINSSSVDNSTERFVDNEELTCNIQLNSTLLGNSIINIGDAFSLTKIENASATGSTFQIQRGVYFIRGHFVNVEPQTLILDQYGNKPNYRVGLNIIEELITPQDDVSLNDNSKGFTNFSAPGADRLKITPILFKKSLDDFDDDNFVELATIENGVLRYDSGDDAINGGSNFSDSLLDTLAKRTYDESGNYVVKPFDVSLFNSLDNNLGNGGLFQSGEFTYSGGIASADNAVLKISSGKAYVNGYSVETTAPTFIDVEKPRTTETVNGEALQYNTGTTLKLNRVYGMPTIGIGNTYIVSLRDSLTDGDQTVADGEEIGLARIYDFRLNSGDYSNNANTNEWGISLYDVQTYTKLTLNEAHTLSVPTYVKGVYSGASGFLRDSISSDTEFTLYDTNGSFIQDEPLMFNGVKNGRIVVSIDEKSISDVKSIFGNDGGLGANPAINPFSANVKQYEKSNIGLITINTIAGSGDDSTIKSTNPIFPQNVKVGDLISYTDLSQSTLPMTVKVDSVDVDNKSVGVSTVLNVAGIVSSFFPPNPGTQPFVYSADAAVLGSRFDNSADDTLYTKLPKKNISTLNLNESVINIRKVFTVNITAAGSIDPSTPMSADVNETFLPFTPQRYTLIRSDGQTEELTFDKFIFDSNSTEIQNIVNLGSPDTGAKLIATLRKTNIKSKLKLKNTVNSIIVDKSKLEGSGIGSTTLNNGLVYGSYPFGTRVEDEFISLNTPDILEIHAIYESNDISEVYAPKMEFSSISNISSSTENISTGEILIGEVSGAIALCVAISDLNTVEFISKNAVSFIEGETVVFQTTSTSAVISKITSNGSNISSNYTFNNGQRGSFYGQGFLRRKAKANSPTKPIKVYFSSTYFDSNDSGDIISVKSYDNFDYSKEIQTVNGISNSDIIDIRPRVTNYSVLESDRSPLEFLGRNFNIESNNSRNILASNENLVVDYSYYLGRIDRLFLTKDGKFQIVYGNPAENPEIPSTVDNSIEIATITYPPYLYNPEQASLKFLEYKRYKMSDIKNLENRISNLEYYTTLSLLESKTESSFIADSEGFNRFKSGFYVDNFTSFKTQETGSDINNSIDRKNKELRPKHYTNSIDMVFGPIENVPADTDYSTIVIDGNNVEKESDILTLSFSEIEWLSQSFATQAETVNPFTVSFWQGSMELTPTSDTWVDTARVKAKIIETEGNYAATIDFYDRTEVLDSQSGFIPLLWDSWETNWIGSLNSSSRSSVNNTTELSDTNTYSEWKTRSSTLVTQENLREYTDLGRNLRDSNRILLYENFDSISTNGDRQVSRDLISFMRPKNIEFSAKRLKPYTQMYPFFDGINVSRYCVPKLLEIEMINGSFQAGENIKGIPTNKGISSPEFYARLANIDHKEGQYNSPDTRYEFNPYTQQPITQGYNNNSTFVNIDTYALSNPNQTQYYGYVEVGYLLVGETSGATATVSGLRHVVDSSTSLIGSFYIPDTISSYHPKFECGSKIFKLTSNLSNNDENVTTVASEVYSSVGLLEESSDIRNIRLEDKQEFEAKFVRRSPDTQIVGTTVLGQSNSDSINAWYDPLAQTFTVDDDTGVFITRCDVYFSSKDTNNYPVTLQIREVESGVPTSKVLPLSEVILTPAQVNTSADSTVSTQFVFKSPVYLEGRKQYAICLLTNSNQYRIYTSLINGNDFVTNTRVSSNPFLGYLYKAQNTSKWEYSQLETLKFNLYRAQFEESGSVDLYNSDLSVSNRQIANLLPNALEFKSKKIRIGLSSTMDGNNGFVFGNTFDQEGVNATGNLVGLGASIVDLSITNPGVGYTPGTGSNTFTSINLTTITGGGRGAAADVTIENGVAIAATITDGGSGYEIGDVVTLSSIGDGAGRNSLLTITNAGSANEIILDNVSGDFVVGSAATVNFTHSDPGIGRTELNNSTGGGVQIVSINQENEDSDGLHIKVNHQNHGMYFSDNLVEISGVESDLTPTRLLSSYDIDSTTALTVEDNSIFQTFEGVAVAGNNVGYLKIGEEVIEYDSTSGSNVIGGNIVRGSNRVTYPEGTLVYKYENSGVNLARINKTHDMNDVSVTNSIEFDSYYIKLNMSEKFKETNIDRSLSTDAPKLYISNNKSSGGYDIRASQNMPYEIISPMIHYKSVQGSSINAQIRTTTSTGIDGEEVPYLNYGFESVSLNRPNYLSTPRAVFSKNNESLKLNNVEGNKSLLLRLFLNSTDDRVSPIIDTQRMNAILTSNRINSGVEDYITDPRVNTIDQDPSAFQYISRELSLENPATSLKIMLNGYINSFSDIRAFYYVGNETTNNPTFIPFPGFDNIAANGTVISPAKNSGKSDVEIQKTNLLEQESSKLEFKEYTFTIDGLQSFKYYRIKLVLTSTNQVYVPRVKDLRVIALA